MYIIRNLRPFLQVQIRTSKIPIELRVLAAVRFFATGSYQRGIGQDCLINMSQSQVCLAITEVANAINTNNVSVEFSSRKTKPPKEIDKSMRKQVSLPLLQNRNHPWLVIFFVRLHLTLNYKIAV